MVPGLCEVVLHDLGDPRHAIRVIENNLSGGQEGSRKAAAPGRVLRLAGRRADHRGSARGVPTLRVATTGCDFSSA
ncbi:PAS domain-containing protein [Streptomyces canus]|nr:PAS domain-containing protein [Streptomyces canus]